MARWMVSLVGEQPIPNFIPVKYSQFRPDHLILVASDLTRGVAQRLTEFLEPAISCETIEVDPYDPYTIRAELLKAINRKPPFDDLVVNLTGGTKVMSLAAFEIARTFNCDALYYQTEGNASRLWHYQFQDGELSVAGVEDLPVTLTLNQYLRLHIGPYRSLSLDDAFEVVVVPVLAEAADEILTKVLPSQWGGKEIDFVIRIGNQVGVGEIKTSPDSKAIGQITTIASRKILGTYVKKFLIHARELDPNNTSLAWSNDIQTIRLPSFLERGALSDEDRTKLVNAIVEAMRPKTSRLTGQPG